MSRHGPKFRFDASGRVTPPGCTVGVTGCGALRGCCIHHDAGSGGRIPPRLVTAAVMSAFAAILPIAGTGGAYRVSRMRVGVTGWNWSPVAPYHPTTSKITCVDPLFLHTLTLTSAPTIAVTRLGTVCPPTNFRFDASRSGRDSAISAVVIVASARAQPRRRAGRDERQSASAHVAALAALALPLTHAWFSVYGKRGSRSD